jgi:putative transposase
MVRKRKGSSNRSKARTRFAVFQARVSARRRDAIHKATTFLAKNHGRVVIEDLRVKGMTSGARGTVEAPGRNVRQKAGLNRVILDKGWGEARRQLDYKCRWYGSRLVAVNPAHTSQECSACHHVDADNRVTRDSSVCLVCGHSDNADVNAARDILARRFAGRPPVTACGVLASVGHRSRKVAA